MGVTFVLLGKWEDEGHWTDQALLQLGFDEKATLINVVQGATQLIFAREPGTSHLGQRSFGARLEVSGGRRPDIGWLRVPGCEISVGFKYLHMSS